MADAITIKALQDASVDAKSLEEVVNGNDTKQVTTRLGENYPSVKKAIKTLFENGGLPATPFKTKALMTASSLANDKYAMVTDDTVNNGLYVKTAGAWVKSDYDTFGYVDSKISDVQYVFNTLSLLKASDLNNEAIAHVVSDPILINNGHYKKEGDYWIPVEGHKSATMLNHAYLAKGDFDIGLATGLREYVEKSYVNSLGVISPSTKTPELTTSVFRSIDPLASKITIHGYGTATFVSLYAYYDADKKYIETPSKFGDGSGIQEFIILKDDIPANAKYIRYTGYIYQSNSIEGVLPLERTATTTEAIVYDVFGRDNVEGLKEFSDYALGGYKGMYMHASYGGELYPIGTTGGLVTSEFLAIDKTKSQLSLRAWGSAFIVPYALYDKYFDPIFIDDTQGDAGLVDVTLNISEIDPLAVYIRYTGREGYPTFISGVKPFSIMDKIRYETSTGKPNPKKVNTIFLSGASLAHSGNKWFSYANTALGTEEINRARSGSGTPVNDAFSFFKGDFYTDEQFEAIDVFAFQYASSGNVHIPAEYKGSASEYTEGFDVSSDINPFNIYSHNQAIDYILRLIQERCYAQKDNPLSKWYGTPYGKPFNLMFVTHWHDARVEYNTSIRELATKWGAGVCEFDKMIGFGKGSPLPDGTQVSTLYAQDNQLIDGVSYGWHPLRTGSDQYIQIKMGDIFAKSIKTWFESLQ